MPCCLVLIRHGQSEWNKKNLFTGWTDIPLSTQGQAEAARAGRVLRQKGVSFDWAFSSALERAIHTAQMVLEETNVVDIPITKSWQLNERHYGALQGQNKQEAQQKYGPEQVQKWRRDFFEKPPPLKQKQVMKNQDLYKGLTKIPEGESLSDTQKRVLPFWRKSICPYIQNGKTILICAHGNSLRALIKELEKISDKDISSLEIKTAKPLIYALNKKTKTVLKKFLCL